MLEHRAGSQAEAQARLDEARAADLVYPEDRAAISQLQDKLQPGYLPPVSGRLDLNLGWAANARAGSPADLTTAGKSESSPLAQTAVWLRFVMPGRSWVRPSLEVETRALGYSASAGRDFSYLMLGGRPGVLLGRGNRRVLLAYHYESLLLAGGDQYQGGPLWFYDSHRGEMEIEVFSGLTVFGGVGKRNFREIGRSRLEADGGIGGGFEARSRLRVLGALSGRYYDAKNDAYDLRGASLLIAADVRLPRRWSMRAGFLGSYSGVFNWRGHAIFALAARPYLAAIFLLASWHKILLQGHGSRAVRRGNRRAAVWQGSPVYASLSLEEPPRLDRGRAGLAERSQARPLLAVHPAGLQALRQLQPGCPSRVGCGSGN